MPGDVLIINHAHDENEPCTSECRSPSGEPVITILDESAVSEIEARAGDKWTVKSETIRALCATVKHLRAQLERGALCEECEQWEYSEDGSIRTFMVCGACWNAQQVKLEQLQAERQRDATSMRSTARDLIITTLGSVNFGGDSDYLIEKVAMALATVHRETTQAALREISDAGKEARIRVGASRNCYDAPDEAESVAKYVADRIETIVTEKMANTAAAEKLDALAECKLCGHAGMLTNIEICTHHDLAKWRLYDAGAR